MAAYNPNESKNNTCSSDEDTEMIQKRLINDPNENSPSEKSEVEEEEITVDPEVISNESKVDDSTEDYDLYDDDDDDDGWDKIDEDEKERELQQELARKQEEYLEWKMDMYNKFMKIINENEFLDDELKNHWRDFISGNV